MLKMNKNGIKIRTKILNKRSINIKKLKLKIKIYLNT